jgi:folate-binding protein YgfZ
VAPVSEQLDPYRTATERCGFVDRSERGKLALIGAGAKEFLQGQVTNDVLALRPGTGCYAAFLTPKGKMLGDLRILDAGDELLLDTERLALQGLFNMIRRFSIGYEVELHKRTLECSLFSLLGPGSYSAAGDTELAPADEHAHRLVEIEGVSARAIRTYDGVDLLCAADDGAALSAVLARRAEPISEETAEILRVEHGRPRYGVDLDDSVIPQEAGLNERAVSFTKGCYVGQETVARLFYKGKPNRHLRGLRCSAPPAVGDSVFLSGPDSTRYSRSIRPTSPEREVGTVSSVAESPRFGHVALALIRREAPPGTAVTVGSEATPAEVAVLPFDRAAAAG